MERTNLEQSYMIQASKRIYDKVYCKFSQNYITVFLCGGAYNRKKKSLRDRLKPMLEHDIRIRGRKVRVYYPEDLLMDIINRNKKMDLLTCENILAENSDFILIICESFGAAVELGMFANKDLMQDRVIVGVNKKYLKEKSFIMEGPIKYLRNKDENNVFFYTDNEKKDITKITNSIKNKYIASIEAGKWLELKVENIIGMHYYIQLLLYYFKELNSKELAFIIKNIIGEGRLDVGIYDLIFQASINLLFREKAILREMKNKVSYYSLTESGHKSIFSMIRDCKEVQESDRISLQVLYYKHYNAPQS